MNDCIFCVKNLQKDCIMDNDLAFAIYDKYPQTQGHVLLIPKRHSENFFKLTAEEKAAIWNLADEVKILLDYKHGPEGYNIIANCGKTAGQVVFHTHVHLIPRYKGDGKKFMG